MSIQTQTFEGTPGGINKAVPAHEIDDLELQDLIDGILDKPGLIRRRGPVQVMSGAYATGTARSGYGMFQTTDPAGSWRPGYIRGDATTGEAILLDDAFAFSTSYVWDSGFSGAYPIFDSKQALGHGAFLSTSDDYGIGATQQLALWRGANKAAYSSGTLTVVRGDTAVTGSGTLWSTNTAPGAFLFNNSNQFIGVVKSVDSNTALTLEAPALDSLIAESYTLKSIRGLNPRVTTGAITVDSADSTNTVLGSFTKFADQGLGSGTWDIYRKVDLTYIGTVNTVTDNSTLTLTAAAGVSMDNEDYVAIHRDGTYSLTPDVGFITATYANRQFYANKGTLSSQGKDQTARIWYSDLGDPEALDLTEGTGNYIEITSQAGASNSIKQIVATQNSMLIFKENETFALYGTSPAQWQVRKLADDGVLSGMSVMPYEGGALWVGKLGIYFYDGVQVRNLANDKLGDYFTEMVKTFDPTTHRMWAMVAREHYLVYIESLSTDVTITKNQTDTSYSRITIAINLRSGAFTFFHPNVAFFGAIQTPASVGKNTVYLTNSSAGNARICQADDLFNDTLGNDTITTLGSPGAGPDFYLQSKKYSMGDGQRKKLWKQLQLWFLATVSGGTDDVTDAISLDTVPGLSTTGTASGTTFKQQSDYDDKRIKFLKRSQYLAFRLYQSSSSVTRLVLAPWGLGFKWQRPGRI